MRLKTCVDQNGQFQWGVHKPHFRADNFRDGDHAGSLGKTVDGVPCLNRVNFPPAAVCESEADWIFEIPNAFPFRGTTYICKSWADAKTDQPGSIRLPEKVETSLGQVVAGWSYDTQYPELTLTEVVRTLPESLRIALASTSTDPDDLVCLARHCCEFVPDDGVSLPVGLKYQADEDGRLSACISDHPLFETLVNNYHLPDVYKEAMVLRPGVQGRSEIVGEWQSDDGKTHVFEYLRRNSYIPWGHYAANMANDAVRYDIRDLTPLDITGLRHLYYQRTYARLARQCGIEFPAERKRIPVAELEQLRKEVFTYLQEAGPELIMSFNQSLWGWNFGFDFAPSGYRLHASHQQIHQQFAMIPLEVPTQSGTQQSTNEMLPSYGCGSLIADFAETYSDSTGNSFFENYIKAIRNNRRTDGSTEGPCSLIVYEDEAVILFVPKAQTSQWELQLMTVKPVGNILEADAMTRSSLDLAMHTAVKVLSRLGARMITTIEYPKSFDALESDQRLLYSFLPKLPESPGAFSEAQLRWINGHYPEDFATACRMQLKNESAT